MDEIKIEKSVPLPSKGSKNAPRYPLEGLEVSDSFFVQFNDEKELTIKSRLSTAMERTGRKLSRKFTMRTLKDGIRIWRIA